MRILCGLAFHLAIPLNHPSPGSVSGPIRPALVSNGEKLVRSKDTGSQQVGGREWLIPADRPQPLPDHRMVKRRGREPSSYPLDRAVQRVVSEGQPLSPGRKSLVYKYTSSPASVSIKYTSTSVHAGGRPRCDGGGRDGGGGGGNAAELGGARLHLPLLRLELRWAAWRRRLVGRRPAPRWWGVNG